ncbi:hypothetical protein F511_09855 [Dorcoceras hygrometricum]|uniref:Uncharacterized protein n=1 Tax=Dorcoceras hygrometricum TaxID=472368 RepID=A0A2Z7CCR1_9LAMI|nr:hypothetical protein F511_09855 [Dorcoceras hygrometricum]
MGCPGQARTKPIRKQTSRHDIAEASPDGRRHHENHARRKATHGRDKRGARRWMRLSVAHRSATIARAALPSAGHQAPIARPAHDKRRDIIARQRPPSHNQCAAASIQRPIFVRHRAESARYSGRSSCAIVRQAHGAAADLHGRDAGQARIQ